jgi:hypothetical protein
MMTEDSNKKAVTSASSSVVLVPDAEDWVEGGSTMSGNGGLSRNATPYSSTNDLRNKSLMTGRSSVPWSGIKKPSVVKNEDGTMVSPLGTSIPSSSSSALTYGAPTDVEASGNFPAIGSTLGPFFSVGRLGKGTFCSIHKCVNLNYFHRTHEMNQGAHHSDAVVGDPSTPSRLAAAKVEIGEFKNSGVLGGEASILHFLHSTLPAHTVPVYMGHYRATPKAADGKNIKKNSSSTGEEEEPTKHTMSAIVMQYLVRWLVGLVWFGCRVFIHVCCVGL